jgi:prolipoprotein diacylglyceryltransferase
MARQQDPASVFSGIERPQRHMSPPARREGSQVLRFVRGLIWSGCLGWTGLVGLFLAWVVLSRSANGIQEASIAAIACAALIGGYACARAACFITREIEG